MVFKIIYFYVHWHFACRYVCARVSDVGVTDSCKLPRGCSELNLGPLEKTPVLLATELSLYPPTFFLFWDRALCSPWWLQICLVTVDGLEFMILLLPLLELG